MFVLSTSSTTHPIGTCILKPSAILSNVVAVFLEFPVLPLFFVED